jgi:hypothetical protein
MPEPPHGAVLGHFSEASRAQAEHLIQLKEEVEAQVARYPGSPALSRPLDGASVASSSHRSPKSGGWISSNRIVMQAARARRLRSRELIVAAAAGAASLAFHYPTRRDDHRAALQDQHEVAPRMTVRGNGSFALSCHF